MRITKEITSVIPFSPSPKISTFLSENHREPLSYVREPLSYTRVFFIIYSGIFFFIFFHRLRPLLQEFCEEEQDDVCRHAQRNKTCFYKLGRLCCSKGCTGLPLEPKGLPIMPSTKTELRSFIAKATADFLAKGNAVTILRPAIAVGSELSINKRALIRRDN